MRVGIVQSTPQFGEIQRNLDEVEQLIGSHDVDLWVLPELFASGYLFLSREEAEGLSEVLGEGPVSKAMLRWAQAHDAAICAGIAERDQGKLYNSALLVHAGGILASYRKLHLFHGEKDIFDRSNTPPPVVEWRGARLGIMICFDWRFPETARSLAVDGADLILHPSNLVLSLSPPAMVTRAQENAVFIFTANRGGVDDRGSQRLEFLCGSQIVDPKGKVLGNIAAGEKGVLVVEIDPLLARDKSVAERNDLLADRRPEHYHLN